MYRSSVIADHERQIITGAVEMIPDIFPFTTNANMFNMHFASYVSGFCHIHDKTPRGILPVNSYHKFSLNVVYPTYNMHKPGYFSPGS